MSAQPVTTTVLLPSRPPAAAYPAILRALATGGPAATWWITERIGCEGLHGLSTGGRMTALRARGLVERADGGQWRLTSAGRECVRPLSPPLPRVPWRRAWMSEDRADGSGELHCLAAIERDIGAEAYPLDAYMWLDGHTCCGLEGRLYLPPRAICDYGPRCPVCVAAETAAAMLEGFL